MLKQNLPLSYVKEIAIQGSVPSKRPDRNIVIQKDKIVDLIIALNTTDSVLDFLEEYNEY